AREAGHEVAVAGYDQSGELLSFARGQASPAAAEVARWKGRSAAVFRRSTLETADWNLPTVPMIATIEGGVPLFTADGAPVGGVGVSAPRRRSLPGAAPWGPSTRGRASPGPGRRRPGITGALAAHAQ